MLHDALLYDELDDKLVQCKLCAHRCKISDGKRGLCRVRENRQGKLYTLVYGNLIAKNADPIEKKPLYHFLPGSKAFSIATPGCNFRCDWCQNWQISQMPRERQMFSGQQVNPEDVVEQAQKSGCQSIAYTYTEPTIFFEYSYDISKLSKAAGLKNIYVTNGFMTAEMLEKIHPCLDAANVDIKSFNDRDYRMLMGGRLEPVLASCRMMKSLGIWLEITTLIVPGVNDDMDELEELARFIYKDLGPETPWHLSRFYPQYKLNDRAPTGEGILLDTKKMAEAVGLSHIYVGNVIGRNSTYCKECGQELISRSGYSTQFVGLNSEGGCQNCKTLLDGVGMSLKR
jgi:pyruvate formate lyase activating enzyme